MEGMELITTRFPSARFWSGKRVLVTGHSGFKGSWLVIWLHLLGAKVSGLSLAPGGGTCLHRSAKVSNLCREHFSDIRSAELVKDVFLTESPDIIFHLAAQPIVSEGFRNPDDTFCTNVMGSVNVLSAQRQCTQKTINIIITTDKVYLDSTARVPYREDDELGGTDPYSSSKACTELVAQTFSDSYFFDGPSSVATARAGNVVGGGDWSTDRIVPDAIRAWISGDSLAIRQPTYIRPWQHVLDALSGYMCLAECLWDNPRAAGPYNFGPVSKDQLRVAEVMDILSEELDYDFQSKKGGGDVYKESPWLGLDISKARNILSYHPRWNAEIAIRIAARWYKKYYAGVDALELCYENIEEYGY